MDPVDRLASLALRFASGRFAVFPDGLGDADLERLAATMPAPSEPIQSIELSQRRRLAARLARRDRALVRAPPGIPRAIP